MPIKKEEFIEELNVDLQWEYAAAIQYIQHAAMITGPEYDAIAEELLVHADEEIGHAKKVADMIADLGGTVTMEVEERKTDDKSQEMLKQDLAGEELAITRYKERIGQAEEMKEYGLRRVLEDILMDEEEHRRDLLSSLGR